MNLRGLAFSLICSSMACHLDRPPADANAGEPDGGGVAEVSCDPDAGIGPALKVASATVLAPQESGWTRLSDAPECLAIQPRSVPPEISWNAPAGTSCDPVLIDGVATVAFSLWTPTSNVTSPMFYRSDGSGATFDLAEPSYLVGNPRGFWLFHSPGVGCTLATRVIDGSIPLETLSRDAAYPLVVNPLGGYVESRTAADLNTVELRWLDDELRPLGEWHAAITRKAGYNSDDRIVVDALGHALLLERTYPPGFGPPPDPSSWVFAARWMDRDGPLSEPFEPIAPVMTSSGRIGWAGWGVTTALADGGIAAFQNTGGWPEGVRPTHPGWYAMYASGIPAVTSAPDWLQQQDGSVRRLTSGAAYAATRRDPNTCALTAMLIAPSGQPCYGLALEHSELCDALETTWPDGTIVLGNPNDCDRHWWPSVAGVQQELVGQ